MKILNKITLKHLKLNRRRTIVTIIGIVLATTLLFSIGLGISTSRQLGIDEAIDFQGTTHVTFNNSSHFNLDILQNDKNIDNILITQIKDAIPDKDLNSKNEKNFNLTIISSDIDYNEHIKLANGKMPESSNEIIVSTYFSQNGEYNIGDYINDYKIVGIYNKNTLYVDEFYTNDFNFIFTPYAYTFNKIDGKYKSNFYITYKSIFNAYSKIYNTAENLGLEYVDTEYNGREYQNTSINYSLLNAYGQFHDSNVQLSTYLILILLLGILCTFCTLVIYNAFAISLSERKKDLGILRSLGATKKQLFNSIMYEASIVSLISIPIGIISSFGLTNIVLLILNKLLETSQVTTFKLSVYPSYIIISLIFILITIFASAYTPSLIASNTSPIEAIKKNKDFSIEKSKEKYPLIKKLFGIEGELAYKNIKRNNSKYSTAISALSISVIFFITISTFINYLISQNQFERYSNFDISFQLQKDEKYEEIIGNILNIDSIDDYAIYKNAYVYYKSLDNHYTDEYKEITNNPYNYISIIGVDKNSFNEYKKELKVPDNKKSIIYNIDYMYDEDTDDYLSAKVFKNDSFTLELCDVKVDYYNDKPKYTENICTLNLDNFYLTNTSLFNEHGLSMIIEIDEYDRLVDEHIGNYTSGFSSTEGTYKDYLLKYINLGIYSKNFKKFDIEIQDILNKYANEQIHYSNYSLDSYSEYMGYIAVLFILYSVIAFISIIAICSIINTINTSMKLREIEFSMYRSIGLSKKKLKKMINLESLFLGIKTLIQSIPTSLILVFTLIVLIEKVKQQQEINFPFPTIYIIISIIAVFLVTFIVMIYSLNKIKNNNIIDSIRNENI